MWIVRTIKGAEIDFVLDSNIEVINSMGEINYQQRSNSERNGFNEMNLKNMDKV